MGGYVQMGAGAGGGQMKASKSGGTGSYELPNMCAGN